MTRIYRQMPHWWWGCVGVALICLLLLPLFVGLDVVMTASIILIYSLLTLSMSFLWGYGGMLSFGQTAFFGLGGYTYAVVALNIGNTTIAILAAIIAAALLAAVLGYFMIYGRISRIYFTVMTLVFTIVLEKAVRATSDERFTIGSVPLRGQNGIANVPDIQIPWDSGETLSVAGVYCLAACCLIVVYVGLRLLLKTNFGRVLVSISDNEQRALLLGYDCRKYQLIAFVLSGALAGIAGVLYGAWGNFVAPEMMNMGAAANIVIYAIVGGKSILVGPIVGTAIVQYLTSWMGTIGVGQVTIVLGLILMAFVMLFPQGVVPTLASLAGTLIRRCRSVLTVDQRAAGLRNAAMHLNSRSHRD